MLRAERVQLAYDHAPDILAGAVRRGERGQELLERLLELAAVKRRESVRELAVLLQARAGGQSIGLEAAPHRGEQLERGVWLSPGDQVAGERHGGVGAARLELE